MLRPLRIAITSGDQNGIGPEVVSKALRKIGPTKGVNFFLWRNSAFPKSDLDRIKKSFKLITVNTWKEALENIPSSSKELVDICLHSDPGDWIEEAAEACAFGHLDALSTAPASKRAIQLSHKKAIGHTDILKKVSQVDQLYMGFIGDRFNVFLLTGHMPLSEVSKKFSESSLIEGATQAHRFCELLARCGKKGVSKKPMALLGLNPHAGDEGIIGNEEASIFAPALEQLKEHKIDIRGPFPADSAFAPEKWDEFSCYIANYHDQGLIPFKTVHGYAGVHITWGLPFIRTSVDHGTAFDIAGESKADPSSMIDALNWAIKLAKEFKK